MSFHCQNLPNTDLTRRREPLYKNQTEKPGIRENHSVTYYLCDIISQDTNILQTMLEKPVIELSQSILTIH